MNEADQEVVDVVRELIDDLSKATLVFRFAYAQRGKQAGAEKRMINAAHEYLKVIEQCDYFT